MLQGGYADVLESSSLEDFRAQLIRFGQGLGFITVAAMAVIDRGVGRSDFVAVGNEPPGYSEAIQQLAGAQRDPVMQHCRYQTFPIVWDQATYVRGGAAELWEEQARFGYRTGIAMALHLPEGRHFAFGVERDQSLPADRGELTRIVAELQLFAVHAQEAALRVMVPARPDEDAPHLTRREVEALQWTMAGKTAWEMGAILGISERTAVLHVNNAMHKLRCSSKHQAVLKALRLGLIRA